MAEILFLTDGDGANGAPMRGDVVLVVDDGYAWGVMETEPPLSVLKVPGASASEFSDLVGRDIKGGRYRLAYLDIKPGVSVLSKAAVRKRVMIRGQ